MGEVDSLKKRKKILKKKRKEDAVASSSEPAQNEVSFYGAKEEVKKKIHEKKKKKSSVEASEEVNVKNSTHVEDEMHEISDTRKKSKKLKIKKRKNARTRTRIAEVGDPHSNQDEDGVSGEKLLNIEPLAKKSQKSKKKKRKSVESINDISEKVAMPERQDGNLLENRGNDLEDEVYEMSSGDEDYSKGMKKWITEYHQSRPGLKVLQERIDDFIINHEAEEEKARAEREAQAAEGGWTVVVHHKGRKKTTEAETGIAVGSVAEAAVLDKIANKKKKDVGLDFYRFQKREAQMNEIMMLQSKFEQDKKRIQQLRAARKFRPY